MLWCIHRNSQTIAETKVYLQQYKTLLQTFDAANKQLVAQQIESLDKTRQILDVSLSI